MMTFYTFSTQKSPYYQQICPQFFDTFAQKKMPVTQMFVNKATLEDIFLELTGDVMEVTNNACYL